MTKMRYWLSAAALAASSIQAFASVPQEPSSSKPATATGLTASDLVVARDGTVPVNVRAPLMKVADNAVNNGC